MTGDRTHRAFIAIEISDLAKKELRRVVDVLEGHNPLMKWVRPETMHITLKFLGDITENDVRRASEAIKKAAFSQESFDISIGELGAFPSWTSPRILWVGLKIGGGKVSGLAGKVGSLLSESGFKGEGKEFTPHITIGRIKLYKRLASLKNIAAKVVTFPVAITVDRITLFKSDLSAGGAVHTPLGVFKFRQANLADIEKKVKEIAAKTRL